MPAAISSRLPIGRLCDIRLRERAPGPIIHDRMASNGGHYPRQSQTLRGVLPAIEARIAELSRRHFADEPLFRDGEQFDFEGYRPAPGSLGLETDTAHGSVPCAAGPDDFGDLDDDFDESAAGTFATPGAVLPGTPAGQRRASASDAGREFFLSAKSKRRGREVGTS